MNSPDVNAGQWKSAIHASGEILTAAAVEPGIELGLIGLPAGYSAPEIAGWLHDLIGVARETGRDDVLARPIPALLHHGLTGLLFSHGQLWNRDGERHPLSYAIVHAPGAVGFGWVGAASVVVQVAGRPADPREVIVRDEEGREARALELPDGDALDLRLEWQPDPATRVVLEAHWPGAAAAAAEPPAPAGALAEMARPVTLPTEAPASAREAEFHAAAGVDRSFFDPEAEPLDLDTLPDFDDAVDASVPQRVVAPADSEPLLQAHATATMQAQAVQADLDPASGAVPQVQAPVGQIEEAPDLSPEPADARVAYALEEEGAFEPEVAPGGEAGEERRPSRLRRMFSRFAFWNRPEVPHSRAEAQLDVQGAGTAHNVPGVPERVPPTPEPADLTARAVDAPSTADLQTAVEEEILVGTETWAEEAAGTASAAPVRGAPVERLQDGGLHVHVGPAPPIDAAPAYPERPVAGPSPAPLLALDQPAAPIAEEVAASVSAPSGETAAPPSRPVRTPMRPQWPAPEELLPPAPLWKRPWVWGVLMAALFAGGWIIGHMNDERRAGAARGVRDALRAVGLGGARFEVMVNSRPQGAWISVDGEDLARRTPATIELEPGEHDVTLSFSDLGAATFQVRGVDGDRLTLEPPLWGSVQISSSDQEVPIAVSVDGVPRGFAPLRVDSLTPGAHEVRFSGPGLPSWGQTVQVRVNESSDLIARPMTSPATGLIEVRATLATESGTADVEGARVWLDGEMAGQTPLTLELPRGPHSIRVEHLGETAPVQVIDLPGGNQRFATFLLRPGEAFPTLSALDPPAVIPFGEPTVISMGLDGVQPSAVREMWLHVQTPDGPWRRYQMAWLKSAGGVVGVAVFPTTLFDPDGRVRYYASASTHAGDEYFSEVQVAASPDAKPQPARPRGR